MPKSRSLLLLALLSLAGLGHPAWAETPSKGEELAFDRNKGNCLACHAMPSNPRAVTSANIGPPLSNMHQRYPDRARLRAQIWDATKNNPNTVMPPFGRNHVLTEQEIDEVTDFIQKL